MEANMWVCVGMTGPSGHDQCVHVLQSIVLPLPEYTAKFIPPKIVSKQSCRGVSISSCGIQYEPWYWYPGHQNSYNTQAWIFIKDVVNDCSRSSKYWTFEIAHLVRWNHFIIITQSLEIMLCQNWTVWWQYYCVLSKEIALSLKYIIDIANTKLTKVKNSQRVLQEEASPHMTWLWHSDSQKPLQWLFHLQVYSICHPKSDNLVMSNVVYVGLSK